MKLGIIKLSALFGLLCMSAASQAGHYITEVINHQSDNCDVSAIAGSSGVTVYEVECPNDTVIVQAESQPYPYYSCYTWTPTSGYYTQDYANDCSHYRVYPE